MKPIAVTMGEPAGIGPDICLALRASKVPVTILGSTEILKARAAKLGQSIDGLTIIDVPGLKSTVTPGELDSQHAAFVMNMLQEAVTRTMQGEFQALVTAPVHKGILNDAGYVFTGHTEFFAKSCHNSKVVMLLVGGDMRVALATTHLPLSEVSQAITPSLLKDTLRIIHRDMQSIFGIKKPKIGVAGLNPHAGEGGHLGCEEIEVITPTLKQLQQEGIDVCGPHPADSLFTHQVMAQYDVLFAMYHDQGLPVLKHASFGQAVNVSLGLPIIRTSVDHGTALPLAGTGQASASSLIRAVALAAALSDTKEVSLCQ